MKKRTSHRWLLWICLAVLLIGTALYNLLPPFIDRRKSAETYETLAETYVHAEPETGDAKEKKKDWWRTDVKVEFDRLKAENQDIIGWIRFDDQDALGINYPILYSGDNETYLRKDLYGDSHIAGSIFLEGLNSPDFSDYYNIIYGHNMRDGSMFGSLKKYREEGFLQEHPYFTVYSENKAWRYQIYAYEDAVNGGAVYKVGYQPGEEYQAFIDQTVKDSLVDTGIRPQSEDKILTLSTCTGKGYSRRLAIHAVCIDAQTTDTSETERASGE